MTQIFLGALLSLASLSVWAGPKEDFVAAVVKQCGKSQPEAESLATPGRTGTVMAFQLCSSGTVDAGGGCSLKCVSKSGNVVGE